MIYEIEENIQVQEEDEEDNNKDNDKNGNENVSGIQLRRPSKLKTILRKRWFQEDCRAHQIIKKTLPCLKGV